LPTVGCFSARQCEDFCDRRRVLSAFESPSTKGLALRIRAVASLRPFSGLLSPETSVRRGALARSWLDSRRIDFHRPIREPDIPRWLLQSRWAPSTVHRAVRSPTTTETVTRFGGSKQRCCVATTACFCGWLSPCGDCQSSFILGQGMASTPPNGTTVIAYDDVFTPTQTARTLLVVTRMGFWSWSQKEPSVRPRAARRAFPRRKITVRSARSALYP